MSNCLVALCRPQQPSDHRGPTLTLQEAESSEAETRAYVKTAEAKR